MKNGHTELEPITNNRSLPTFAGRSLGITVLVSVQSLVGAIHVFFGLWLLFASTINYPYSVYTTVFGLTTLFFTLGFWKGKRCGWFGIVATLMFVIVADALTLFNLPSIPGIPRFAAFAEIGYSILLLLYLFQRQVRAKAR